MVLVAYHQIQKIQFKLIGITVSIRFMEMSVLDAFRLFNERFPGLVGRSTSYSSRPRDVKIVSLHDTCMCIAHENMNLLIKVRICSLSSIYFSKDFNRISCFIYHVI